MRLRIIDQFDYGCIADRLSCKPATAGERYLYNITSPICSELWGRTTSESTGRIATLASEVRYDTIDFRYNLDADVAPKDINARYRLIDTLFLSGDELLVVYSAHLDALGANRPNCGWSRPEE